MPSPESQCAKDGSSVTKRGSGLPKTGASTPLSLSLSTLRFIQHSSTTGAAPGTVNLCSYPTRARNGKGAVTGGIECCSRGKPFIRHRVAVRDQSGNRLVCPTSRERVLSVQDATSALPMATFGHKPENATCVNFQVYTLLHVYHPHQSFRCPSYWSLNEIVIYNDNINSNI